MADKGGEANRQATTNIKVTRATHVQIQVAAELAQKTQSDVISEALLAYMPELAEELSRREALRAKLIERQTSQPRGEG